MAVYRDPADPTRRWFSLKRDRPRYRHPSTGRGQVHQFIGGSGGVGGTAHAETEPADPREVIARCAHGADEAGGGGGRHAA